MVVAVLLAACEGVPTREDAAPPRPEHALIGAFSIEGRISVRQGETRHHTQIAWQHTAAADDILLSTPLGQGVAELSRDAHGARLLTGDGETTAPDWTTLADRVFGFPLPLADLPQWLVGLAPITERDAQGRPTAARAEGWEIRYLDYESAETTALPVLMEFRRDDIELRLKVDQWRLQ